MNRAAAITLLGLACACLCTTGCSDSRVAKESSSVEAEATSARAATPAGGERRNSCDLITGKEASAILGEPVVPREDPATGSCFYGPATGTSLEKQEFSLKVYWTGGREEWDLNQQTAALTGQVFGVEDDEPAAGVLKSDETPLGDKSMYSPVLGGYVLKGDVLLQFDGLLRLKDARSQWEQLARKALSRL